MINQLLHNALAAHQQTQHLKHFTAYLDLLEKWNKTYNLTAIRTRVDMISKHIQDSLAMLPYVQGTSLLDVGSGAGLPGLPIAICRPDLHVVLLDSNGKKTRFLAEVVRTLGLQNIHVEQNRVEDYPPATRFDTVISRAFSNLAQFVGSSAHLIADNGIWLGMKGRYPAKELAAINKPYRIETYHVQGIEGERCVVLVRNE